MSGRFLTAPFAVSVVLAVRELSPLFDSSVKLALGVLVVAIGIVSTTSPWRPTVPSCSVPPSGIVDERACYVEHTGIIRNLRRPGYREHPYFSEGSKWRAAHQRVVVSSLVGLAGYAAGPNVHIVDAYALTDPLLARIPFPAQEKWRIGHWPRPLPQGYSSSLEQGDNELTDPCLRAFYEHLHRVVAGPVWSWERVRSIWLLNSGRLDHLVAPGCTGAGTAD